jgi:hypothetical protein
VHSGRERAVKEERKEGRENMERASFIIHGLVTELPPVVVAMALKGPDALYVPFPPFFFRWDGAGQEFEFGCHRAGVVEVQLVVPQVTGHFFAQVLVSVFRHQVHAVEFGVRSNGRVEVCRTMIYVSQIPGE